jgi:SPP1 gp7 family putative phage head morphogenesis protein
MPTKHEKRRETEEEIKRWRRVRNAELLFGRALRAVAAQIGAIVKGFDHNDPEAQVRIEQLLRQYSVTLGPWARSVAQRMILEVSRRDEVAFNRVAKTMSRNLRKELEGAPIGDVVRESLNRAVPLITSLPTEAAERVHQLTLEARTTTGARAAEIAQRIYETGNVTKARAMLIARTEVARTASAITAARAQHVGSTHFIWRSVEDPDVRPLHKKLNGTVHRWDDPPVSDERTGIRSLPGQIWNCRCIPEPVLPDVIE